MTESTPALSAEFTGTEITRFNALRHGVLSRYTVLPWEDADEHGALVASLLAEHRPQGPTEEHLVEELAGVLWRKRRLRLAEAAAHRRGLENSFFEHRRTAKAALVHITSADKSADVSEAVRITRKDTEEELRDLEDDEAMTRRALAILESRRNDAYETALAELREDTQGWWADVAGRSVGALSGVEGPRRRGRADCASGLFRRRQRQGPALLSGECCQCRDRGHRQGPRPRAAGDGDGDGQDLYGVSDHLALVESGPQKAHPVPRRPQRADRPDNGERLPPVRREDGKTFDQFQDHRAAGRHDGRSDAGARQESADRHRLRGLSRALSGDHRPGGAAEALSGVFSHLLRPDRDRRVPSRQRGRGFRPSGKS